MSSSPTYPKLVFLVSRFPYPLEKGDKLRAYYQIKELSKYFRVHLIALSDRDVTENSISELEKYCASVTIYNISLFSRLYYSALALFGNNPIQVGYFYNRKVHRKISQQLDKIQPDHIISQLIRTAEYTKNYHHCSKTIDYMDALSKGIERRIAKASFYNKWFFKLEFRRLRNYERLIFDYFELHTIISEQDKKLLPFLPNKDKIICIPNGISKHFFETSKEKSAPFDLVFVGNMSYAPNINAVRYTTSKILSQKKEITYFVSGAQPSPSIENIANSSNQIELSGWVDDIRTSYVKGKIFFAPMQIGTGMQNKLLEAMAMGIPCITTELANNAIQAVHNESIIVANTAGKQLEAIEKLLHSPEERKRIGQNGSNFVRKKYDWEIATQLLIDAIKSKSTP